VPPGRQRPAPLARHRPRLHWGGIFRRHCGESRGHSHLRHWRPRSRRVRVKRRPTRRQIPADAFNVLPLIPVIAPKAAVRPIRVAGLVVKSLTNMAPPSLPSGVAPPKNWCARQEPESGRILLVVQGANRALSGRCRQLSPRLAPFLLGKASISHQSLPAKSDQQPAIGHGRDGRWPRSQARPPRA
jgi:hypothetical protein